MASQSTKLEIHPRETGSSRSTRRLRRAGRVPGIIYGGDAEPLAFAVDERDLRHALAGRGAVVELELDGQSTTAVLKDAQRHPVRGHTMHVDFLRVRLDVVIGAVVPLELVGGDDAPGTREGGVLEHIVREVHIEALPNDIPERIELDVSQMQVNDTLHLDSVQAPSGVTILGDLEETVATLTPPRLQAELEEGLEAETQIVGQAGAAPAVEDGDEPADAGDGSSE